MTFSQYANILYKFHSGNKYEFTKELLKAGLNDYEKSVINDMALDYSESGKDRLRKYLSGERNITEIAKEIVTYFDKSFFVEYLEECYEDKFTEMHQEFSKHSISIDEDNWTEKLSGIFYDILNEAAKGKTKSENKEANNTNPKSQPDENAYVLTSDDKQGIKCICKQIGIYFNEIMNLTNHILNNQFELNKLDNSEVNLKLKQFYEFRIDNDIKSFNSKYIKLEKLCADFVSIYGTKRNISIALEHIYDIADGISDNKYKITCPKVFNYSLLSLTKSSFDNYHKHFINYMDKL